MGAILGYIGFRVERLKFLFSVEPSKMLFLIYCCIHAPKRGRSVLYIEDYSISSKTATHLSFRDVWRRGRGNAAFGRLVKTFKHLKAVFHVSECRFWGSGVRVCVRVKVLVLRCWDQAIEFVPALESYAFHEPLVLDPDSCAPPQTKRVASLLQGLQNELEVSGGSYGSHLNQSRTGDPSIAQFSFEENN